MAHALNSAGVRAHGVRRWDAVTLCLLVFFRGSFLSAGAVLDQFLPFAVIVLLAVVLAVVLA